MRKALGLLLAVMMVTAFWPLAGMNVSAATENNHDQGAFVTGHGDSIEAARGQNKLGKPVDREPKAGEVIVLLKDSGASGLSSKEAKKIKAIEALADGSEKGPAVEIADGINVIGDEVWTFEGGGSDMTVAVAASKKLSTKKMVKELESEDIVEAVSPNYSRHACTADYGQFQWNINDYPGVGAKSEWESAHTTGGQDNIVAVIDTGVNYKHDELRGSMWKNPFGNRLKGKCGFDFVNGDADPMDDNGHGSHCSGIIGAAADNAGISGVSPTVSIMALKVLDGMGYGWDGDIIAAYNYVYEAMRLMEKDEDNDDNVVAVSCSFGGGGYDEVMEKVIEKLGQKGALCVCAAGNESENNDEVPSYPANYDCDNIISVAASKQVGDTAEMVSFSNYGEETVDIAAPGTDILSTVSYDCFNPTLYRDDMGMYYDYGEGKYAYLDGSAESKDRILNEFGLTNLSAGDIETAPGFYSDECLKINFSSSGLEEGQKWHYFAIPYDLDESYDPNKEDVMSSIMVRTEAPEDASGSGGSDPMIIMMDVPRSLLSDNSFMHSSGDELTWDYPCGGYYVYGVEDYWSHIRMARSYNDDFEMNSYNPDKDRERAILIIGQGDYSAYIDDIGVSKVVNENGEKDFGQYDFYSGTSMATPCVAGAVALTAAVKGTKDPNEIMGELLCTANDNEGHNTFKVSTGGALDFGNKGNGFWIGITSATVNTADNTITLKGGFKIGEGSIDVKIRKTTDETPWEDVPKATIVGDPAEKEIVVEDNGWINNNVDISVSGTKDGKTKTSTKSNIYLVKGKSDYDVLSSEAYAISSEAALATDGKKIYAAESTGDFLCALNPNNYEEGAEVITIFTKEIVQEYFEDANDLNEDATYDFRFGGDLVLIGKTLYVKGLFCQVAGGNEDEDEDYSNRSVAVDEEYEDNDTFPDSPGAAYTEEDVLLAVNTETGDISACALPKGGEYLTDSKLASFDGSLYLLGGINESEDELSDALSSKVYKYNAAKDTWTAAADMPAGRAGGKVLQSRDKLIYTLGYSADSEMTESGNPVIPANYVFDGSGWTEGSAVLKPVFPSSINRAGHDFLDIRGSVGMCADGLVYMAAPAEDYGDTFIYDVKNDKFKSTKWNYTKNMDDVWALYDSYSPFAGTAVGSNLIGFNSNGDILIVKNAVKSALLSVSAAGAKGGKVTGTGDYLYGSKCTVKAIANPGYYAKSLSVSGAKAKTVSKGLSASFTVKKDVEAKATFAKMKVKVKSKITVKAGKSKKLKAKITPTAAAKQWKLAYKSSNTKYAKVTSKGVVKAKKAGKGKTVKIKIILKGTKKVMKTVKVKIK